MHWARLEASALGSLLLPAPYGKKEEREKARNLVVSHVSHCTST